MIAVAWVLVIVFDGPSGGGSVLTAPFADRVSCEAAREHITSSVTRSKRLDVISQGCYSTRAPA